MRLQRVPARRRSNPAPPAPLPHLGHLWWHKLFHFAVAGDERPG